MLARTDLGGVGSVCVCVCLRACLSDFLWGLAVFVEVKTCSGHFLVEILEL